MDRAHRQADITKLVIAASSQDAIVNVRVSDYVQSATGE